MQRRLLEVIRQQPETWNVGRPTPARGPEREQGDFQDVAGLCTFDPHRSRQRIDPGEVQTADVIGGALGPELTPGGIRDVELQGLARCNPYSGPQAIVPAVVLLMNGVSVFHRL